MGRAYESDGWMDDSQEVEEGKERVGEIWGILSVVAEVNLQTNMQ